MTQRNRFSFWLPMALKFQFIFTLVSCSSFVLFYFFRAVYSSQSGVFLRLFFFFFNFLHHQIKKWRVFKVDNSDQRLYSFTHLKEVSNLFRSVSVSLTWSFFEPPVVQRGTLMMLYLCPSEIKEPCRQLANANAIAPPVIDIQSQSHSLTPTTTPVMYTDPGTRTKNTLCYITLIGFAPCS